MPNTRSRDENSARKREDIGVNQPESGEDTEGHMFNIDPYTQQQLTRQRSADVERELRERKRQKEARTNRR